MKNDSEKIDHFKLGEGKKVKKLQKCQRFENVDFWEANKKFVSVFTKNFKNLHIILHYQPDQSRTDRRQTHL